MFRPDVKTEGLTWVIRACGELRRRGNNFHLVIAGDGKEKDRLQRLAREHLPHRFHFAGEIPRKEMYRYYSACDLFVFPGIRESLGMVFLEAQSCGLPVVEPFGMERPDFWCRCMRPGLLRMPSNDC
jgi:glycosyltransferase involved in cell wall biosynthesis